jgi:hypothetical protein
MAMGVSLLAGYALGLAIGLNYSRLNVYLVQGIKVNYN